MLDFSLRNALVERCERKLTPLPVMPRNDLHAVIAKEAQGLQEECQAAAWRTLSCPVTRDAMSDPFDAAELFDVEMDHLARRLLFMADDRDPLIAGRGAWQTPQTSVSPREQIAETEQLEHVPIKWFHLIEKDSLKSKELEHVRTTNCESSCPCILSHWALSFDGFYFESVLFEKGQKAFYSRQMSRTDSNERAASLQKG